MIKRTIYAFAFDLVFSLLPPSSLSLSLSLSLFWESDPPLRQIHSDLPMFKTKSKWRGSPPPKFSGETRTRTERHVARARNNRNHHDGRHSGEALVGQLPDAAGPHPALQVRCPPKEFKDFAFRLNLGRVRARDGVVPGLASGRAEAALRGLPCLRPSPASALSDASHLCQPSTFSLSPFSPIPGAEALRAARERPRLSSRQAGGLASRARGARASWPGRPRVWPPRRTPP